MYYYLLTLIFTFFLINLGWAGEETVDPNLNKPLSETEILNNIKKIIAPVVIKGEETSSIVKKNDSKLSDTSMVDINVDNKATKEEVPENINYLLATAFKASQLGQFEAAIVLYNKALKIDPNNTYTLFALGSLYQKLKQYSEAKTIYGKLLTIDPKNEAGINNYLALIAESSPAKALVQLQEMEKINPNFSPVKAQIGMIYANMHEYTLAEIYFRKAIILSPEIINYRYNLAILYDKMQHFKMAIQMYKQVVDFAGDEMAPNDIKIILNRIKFLRSRVTE